MSFINAIETALPEHVYSQEELRDFYINSTDNEAYKRKIKIVANRSGIAKRYSVIGDFQRAPEDFEFFNKNSTLLPEPTLKQRMQLYKKKALPLAETAVLKIKNFQTFKKNITHLITVTCTGMFAPGLDIELMNLLGLNTNIQRNSVNFMGCNAAILALKQADAICKSTPTSNVLVVCVELCTLHFQKRYNDDYILSNLIFADGAAAVIVSSEVSRDFDQNPAEIKLFNSLILHDGGEHMAWQLSETGFIMNLSAYVSGLIKENMKPMLVSLKLNVDEIDQWAIHPGGKRILDDFCATLGLKPSQLLQTYQVLNDHGNMSSPTVLFVLKKVLADIPEHKKVQRIFTAAFGPGISIETMQLINV